VWGEGKMAERQSNLPVLAPTVPVSRHPSPQQKYALLWGKWMAFLWALRVMAEASLVERRRRMARVFL
jgi:hypothetical protein